jgi:hypothetical protein
MTVFAQPLQGEALLDELEKRAVAFLWYEYNPRTGLTKDRASNSSPDKFDVASIASVGFALAAYPIGVERKWIDRKQALERTRLTLDTILNKLDGTKGWYYHFVNWDTGKRMWNCELSTIDSSIMFAGVIASREYWKDPKVTKDADEVMRRVDWQHMMRDTQGNQPHEFFSMGWKPEDGWIKATWAAYNELMMLYIQAYGFSNVPTDGWDKFGREVFTDRGHTSIEGGPLFMHQMSHGWYDFSDRRDRLGFNYWVATREATLANRAYCIDNPKEFKGYGPHYWGLSACDTPDGYRALGAPPRAEDNGTITPTSAVASLQYTPKESLEFAEGFYRDYPKAWGRYGWSNGVNVDRNWYGPDVIGIDLGMMLLGIENYRTGLPHKLSMSNASIRRGFEKAGLRVMKDSNKGPLRVEP